MVENEGKKIILLEIEKINKIMQKYRQELNDSVELIIKNFSFKNTLEKVKIQQLRIRLKQFLDYYYKQWKKFEEFTKNLAKFWEDPTYYLSEIDFYNCLSADLEVARAYVREVHRILSQNDLKSDLFLLKKFEKVLCDTLKSDLPGKEVKE